MTTLQVWLSKTFSIIDTQVTYCRSNASRSAFALICCSRSLRFDAMPRTCVTVSELRLLVTPVDRLRAEEEHLVVLQPILLPHALQQENHLQTATHRVHGDQDAAVLVAQRVGDQITEPTVLRLPYLVTVPTLRHVLAGVRDEQRHVPRHAVTRSAEMVVREGIHIHRIHQMIGLGQDVPYRTADDVARFSSRNNATKTTKTH